MGYRSVVALALYENDYQEMLRRAISENNESAMSLIRYGTMYKTNNVITLYWTWVKWYESYDDVSFIMNFIRSGIDYSFKRAGEEPGDVEEEYQDDGWVLGETTNIYSTIDLCDAGEQQSLDSYINSIQEEVNKEEEKIEQEIEEVSQEELMKLIA